MKKIYLFIVAALVTTVSWGQFTEDFNYTTGSNLAGAGGNGYTQITAGTTGALTVNNGGLTYLNSLSNGVGFGVNAVAGQQAVAKSALLGHSNTNGAVAYTSFLMNVSSLTGITANGFNFFGLMVGSISTTSGVSSRVLVKQNGTGFSFGIGKSAIAVPNVAYESTVRNFNETYLVVVKYTVTTTTTNTDDVVELWVNPTLGAAETMSNLSTTLGTDAGNALIGPVINPRGTGAPSFEIDAIRVGLTWASVTPIAVPTLTVTPATPLVIATVPVNTTSPSVSFNLAGTFLTPAPGTITVASPNAAFQVSTDNVSFSSSVNIPNTTATLAATAVYVRFSSATSGAATVNLNITGGGVTIPPTVTVNAGAGTPYFSKPTGSLHVIGTWGTATNGTGTAPVDFISDYQIFTIANRTNYTLDDDFQVFGVGSKIIVGDGTNPIKVILPAMPTAYTILNDIDHKVDVSNNATLEIANKVYRSPGDLSKTPFPYFGVMDNNSTVEYSYNGTDVTDTVRIPAETFGNLKLTNGLKYFSSGFAFANGILDITNVVGLNGTGNGSASILVRGNITMSNSFFDVGAIADANRINLNLGGVATQTLSGGDFYVGQLRTQAVSPTVPAFALDIVLGANTNIITGTTTGGGINLQQPMHNLSLNGKTLTMGNGSSFVSTNQGTISGTSTSNLLINKTVGTAAIGTVNFKTGGQVLNDFNFNAAGTGTNNLNLNSPLTVEGILSLNAGNILLGSNNLTSAGSISGGSVASHIVTNGTGSLKVNAVGATPKTFPVGPTTALYHPASITNTGTVDNFLVNVTSAFAPCVDNLASVNATWNITEETVGGSNCTIALDYTGATNGISYAPAAARVADCGGVTPFYSNGTVSGNVATGSGFTSFSPFSVTSNIIALPVTFISFSGSRVSSNNNLKWVTVSEINNRGFEIQRSQNGQNFSTIGFVNSNTTVGSNSSYNFVDYAPTGSLHYYRLLQIDNNNQSKFSQIIKIRKDQGSKLNIENIVSNPVKNNLVANVFSPIVGNVNLQVIDMTGKIVASKQVVTQIGTNNFSINISNLETGMYLLKATNISNNQISLIKFIKE